MYQYIHSCLSLQVIVNTCQCLCSDASIAALGCTRCDATFLKLVRIVSNVVLGHSKQHKESKEFSTVKNSRHQHHHHPIGVSVGMGTDAFTSMYKYELATDTLEKVKISGSRIHEKRVSRFLNSCLLEQTHCPDYVALCNITPENLCDSFMVPVVTGILQSPLRVNVSLSSSSKVSQKPYNQEERGQCPCQTVQHH